MERDYQKRSDDATKEFTPGSVPSTGKNTTGGCSAGNIHYDIADRAGGLAYGGVGGIRLPAKRTELMKAGKVS